MSASVPSTCGQKRHLEFEIQLDDTDEIEANLVEEFNDIHSIDAPPKKRVKQSHEIASNNINKNPKCSSNSNDNEESKDENELETFLKDIEGISANCAQELIIKAVTSSKFENPSLLSYLSKQVKQLQKGGKQHCLLCHKDFYPHFNDNKCILEHDPDERYSPDRGECPCGDFHCPYATRCRFCGETGCDGVAGDACHIGTHVTSPKELKTLGLDQAFDDLQAFAEYENDCKQCDKIFKDSGVIKVDDDEDQ